MLVDVGVSFPDETLPGHRSHRAGPLGARAASGSTAILLTHGHEDHIGALPLCASGATPRSTGFRSRSRWRRRRLRGSRALDGPARSRPAAARRSCAGRLRVHVLSRLALGARLGGRSDRGGRAAHRSTPATSSSTTIRPTARRPTAKGSRPRWERASTSALVDSTNAERPGRSLSERAAGRRPRARRSQGARGAIILTTFSSHVARVSQAVEAGLAARPPRRLPRTQHADGRPRSPSASAGCACRRARVSPPRICGRAAAGAPALPRPRRQPGRARSPPCYRLALDEHADLELSPRATSCSSRRARSRATSARSTAMTDHLVRRGARVLREAEPPMHVSGHAHRGGLADWLELARPRAVMPVHGERRMLAAAAEVAPPRAAWPRPRPPAGQRRPPHAFRGPLRRSSAGPSAAGRIFLDARPEAVGAEIVRSAASRGGGLRRGARAGERDGRRRGRRARRGGDGGGARRTRSRGRRGRCSSARATKSAGTRNGCGPRSRSPRGGPAGGSSGFGR